MILRVLLTATLIVNPIADAMAVGRITKTPARVPFAGAFRPNAAASTRLTQSDAQDWIIEGAANKVLGNTARALELFEAARSRLEAEKLPETYAAEIHERMNRLIISVGGSATEHEVTPAEPEAPVQDPVASADPAANPVPGNGTPFNGGGTAAAPATAKPGAGTPAPAEGIPNWPDISQIAEGIPLDDVGLPVTKTKKPSNANLLIASPALALTDLNMLMKNEDLRSLMWWITTGRIAFYSKDKNLLQIIKRRVSRSDLNQLDSLRNNFGIGSYSDVNMGVVTDLLSMAGLVNKDYIAEARTLLQMFDGSSLTEISNTYVKQAIVWGAVSGGTFALWPTAKKLGPTIGTNGGIGGGFVDRMSSITGGPKVLADSTTSLLLTSKYIFKMAGLYGVELDSTDQTLIGLLALAFAKARIAKLVTKPRATQASIDDAIEPIAAALRAEGAGYAKAKRKSKVGGTKFLADKLGKMRHFLGGTDGTPTMPSSGNAGDGGTPPSDPNNPFPNPDPNQPDPNQPKPDPTKPRTPPKPRVPPTLRQKIGMYKALAARTAIGAGLGALHAGAATAIARELFKGAYAENVKLQNKGFLRLLNSKKGFAFLKLLIHSMYLEQERVTPLGKRTPSINFILNLARAGGICSAEDFRQLEANRGKAAPSLEIRKLRYSCPKAKDTYYHDLLMRELLTFNAIRTKNVARLRASILRDRLKMAQLLLQFQYMDGHQSEDEYDYFEAVTSKILGVTLPEQSQFLHNFGSYIQQSGGMQPNVNSVTGYAVRRSKEATSPDFNLSPDFSLSPTPLDAPSQVLAVDWTDETELQTNGSFNSRPSPF